MSILWGDIPLIEIEGPFRIYRGLFEYIDARIAIKSSLEQSLNKLVTDKIDLC